MIRRTTNQPRLRPAVEENLSKSIKTYRDTMALRRGSVLLPQLALRRQRKVNETTYAWLQDMLSPQGQI